MSVEPRDPSLALCQICANADLCIPSKGVDGIVYQFATCILEIAGNCNDFTPRSI